MGSEIIIRRDEADEIKEMRGWTLIYGRRKVGKTFLIKNFLDYDSYFRVKRDGKILAEEFILSEINSLGDFSKAVQDMLKQNKTIVIDEFQRLPESILEEIAVVHPKGKLIFCGSSMRVIQKIFGAKSPLLGLVSQYRLGLVKPRNILKELPKKGLTIEQAIELSPYISDVWTVPFLRVEKSSLETIYNLLKGSKLTIPALIGEVFTEEERELTRTYEAILRLIGAGEWDYRQVARILADRGLIDRADSSLVLPYIKNLVGMGLVEPLPLLSSKKKMYKLTSPMMEAFYYLSDRYDFKEVDVSLKEVRPTLEKLRNLAVQNWVADLFAETYQGRKEYFVTPEKEIDFIITIRKKPVVVGEVKWGRYNKGDIEKFKEKTRFIKTEKVFIVKEKMGIEDKEVKIIDARDMAKMR
ncbi:MAG: AAA family ATPase [Candidatus Altiarchaeales archaeon]|nr:AAA family ATPase [Candidatus Altiarchaeota archaeon]MBU4341237.1 AAA family ATPase [Candidatus Altiarchaeota archaeon]MCG2782499.1 AAA family ATPase [Candidatus Altiarchaeales archaeon]